MNRVLSIVVVTLVLVPSYYACVANPVIPGSIEKELAKPPDSLKIESLKVRLNRLLSQQNSDGRFGESERCFGTTAFVLSALADSKAPRNRAFMNSMERAAQFLISRQSESGAFVDRGKDESSVALLALLAFQNRGKADEECILPLIRVHFEQSLATQTHRGLDDQLIELANAIYCDYQFKAD